MGKNTDNSCDETDPVSPEEADRKGKVNIVKSIMDDPQIRALIKNALLPETIRSSLIFACFIVGVLKLYDVAKILIGFNVIGDLIIGLALFTIGLIYLLPILIKSKKNGDSKANHRHSDAG